jgi:hypothetical protein
MITLSYVFKCLFQYYEIVLLKYSTLLTVPVAIRVPATPRNSNNYWTNSMEQGPSWEANSCHLVKKFLCLLWNKWFTLAPLKVCIAFQREDRWILLFLSDLSFYSTWQSCNNAISFNSAINKILEYFCQKQSFLFQMLEVTMHKLVIL